MKRILRQVVSLWQAFPYRWLLPFLSLAGLYSIYLMGYLLAVPPSFRSLILTRSVTTLLPELLLNLVIAVAITRVLFLIIMVLFYCILDILKYLRVWKRARANKILKRLFRSVLRLRKSSIFGAFWLKEFVIAILFSRLNLGEHVSLEYAMSLGSIILLSLVFLTPIFPLMRKFGMITLLIGSEPKNSIFRNVVVAAVCAAAFSFGQHRMLAAATECAHFLNGRGSYAWYAPIDYFGDSVIGVEAIYLNSSFAPLFKIKASVFSLMPIALGAELQDNLGFPSSWRLSEISVARQFSCSDLGDGPWSP